MVNTDILVVSDEGRDISRPRRDPLETVLRMLEHYQEVKSPLFDAVVLKNRAARVIGTVVGQTSTRSIRRTAPAPVTAPGRCGQARKIQQHLEQLTRLPKAKRRAVMQLLDSVLAQAEL